MKVGLVSPDPSLYGGIANWTRLMKRYVSVSRLGISLTIITVMAGEKGTWKRLLPLRILRGSWEVLVKYIELKRFIKKENPDVVHFTAGGGFSILRDVILLKLSRQAGIPTVYQLRFGKIKDIARLNTREWRTLLRAFRYSTLVMTVDSQTCKELKKCLPRLSVVYIPNPFDPSILPELKPTHSKTVVFLGLVEQAKGIEDLLVGWKKIHHQHPDWHLNLIGPGNKTYLKYLTDNFSLSGVSFLGRKDHGQTLDLLNNAEIFISPSYTEGFPNSVLEAMALSKPIIASSVGALPDMLSGNCGILISPKSPRAIERAVVELIDNPSKRGLLAKNAKKKADQKFCIDKIFIQYCLAWSKLSKKRYK
jgi:glycosyltransferase involved in cell wall biosynthesis